VPDLNGDQFPEIIFGLPLSDLPNLADAGKAEVVSIGGARQYGIDPSQEMRLSWEPTGASGNGHLQVAFGVGLVPGFLIASSGQSTTAVANQTILVDLTPGEWISVPVPLNGSGIASVPLDLTDASLDATMVFVQAAQVVPATFLVSNGLQLLFCR
jgi:hypothetical protein